MVHNTRPLCTPSYVAVPRSLIHDHRLGLTAKWAYVVYHAHDGGPLPSLADLADEAGLSLEYMADALDTLSERGLLDD